MYTDNYNKFTRNIYNFLYSNNISRGILTSSTKPIPKLDTENEEAYNNDNYNFRGKQRSMWDPINRSLGDEAAAIVSDIEIGRVDILSMENITRTI